MTLTQSLILRDPVSPSWLASVYLLGVEGANPLGVMYTLVLFPESCSRLVHFPVARSPVAHSLNDVSALICGVTDEEPLSFN